MPITIRDDDVNGRPFFTIRDDDTRAAIMAVKVLSEGGTGSNMSATGPGLVQQATAGANFSVLTVGRGALVIGAAEDAGPTVHAYNSTSTRKYLMQRCLIANTPATTWSTIDAADIVGGTLAVARGGTGLSAGATGPGVVVQESTGAAFTVQTATGTGNVVRATTPTFPSTFEMTDTSVGKWVVGGQAATEFQINHVNGALVTAGLMVNQDGAGALGGLHVDANANVGIGNSGFGTNAAGVLGLYNSVVPATSPADMVQLFSVDLSAGNATLGIRTETAVVTESVTSDRTLAVNINGTTYKICLKV